MVHENAAVFPSPLQVCSDREEHLQGSAISQSRAEFPLLLEAAK
jgi:hypothetical protein